MPIVSVIVPVYKVENYLERCVSSIIGQTFRDIEVILVDDGSPDRCGEMCNEWAKKDERVKVIHKENGGLSDARNAGIEIATGDYLFFVDSDDWLDADMIEILYKVLIEYNADIAECSYRNLYSDGVKEETLCTAEIITGDNVFALEGMLDWKYFKPNAWNKLYKRSVIADIRYPKGKIHEDEFTTYKFFYNAKKLVYVDVSKYNYDRRRMDSITGEKFREANLDACFALRERVQFFYDNEIKSLYRKMNDLYCWIVLEYMYRCYQNEIRGSRVDELLAQVKNDVVFFADKDVNQNYYKDLKLLAKGLKHYGYARNKNENN